MPVTPSTTSLADLPESALWTSRSWVDFAALSAARRTRTPVVLPLVGMADWGLGRPLDLEEVLATAVLRRALEAATFRRTPPVVLPPLRFVLGPYPHTLFGLDFETALAQLVEIATGVRAAGLVRLVFFNTSPWNEELAEVAACDARVELGLETFVVNLAALGLDLHPVRSADRAGVQCAACACLGRLPDTDAPPAAISLPDFRPGHIHQPSPLPFAQPLETAVTAGRARLDATGNHLAALLSEIAGRKPRSAPRPGIRTR